MTVLRSPIYAHHVRYVPEADGNYSFIDQGIQHFNYSLLPHEGTWEQAGTARRAAELNCKPVAVIETSTKASCRRRIRMRPSTGTTSSSARSRKPRTTTT